jgi:hypothetical protein
VRFQIGRTLSCIPSEPAPPAADLPSAGRAPSPADLRFMEFEASPPEHAAENVGAGDLKLSERELTLFDAAFRRGPKPAVLPMIWQLIAFESRSSAWGAGPTEFARHWEFERRPRRHRNAAVGRA